MESLLLHVSHGTSSRSSAEGIYLRALHCLTWLRHYSFYLARKLAPRRFSTTEDTTPFSSVVVLVSCCSLAELLDFRVASGLGGLCEFRQTGDTFCSPQCRAKSTSLQRP
jgi:hypothetical protein